MICISGWAGTGKDEIAGRLVKIHNAIHTGLADPGKRHLMDAYGFTENQLWGPSKFRNAGDPRYPKPIVAAMGLEPIADEPGYWGRKITNENRDVISDEFDKIGEHGWSDFIREKSRTEPECDPYNVGVIDSDPKYFLSPRQGLQEYMELMNKLYADTWIRKGIDIHRKLAEVEELGSTISHRWSYSKIEGLQSTGNSGKWLPNKGVVTTCYSDFRHIHEHKLARASADDYLVPVLLRVKRPTVTKPPFPHRSETEQTRIRDAAYDFVIDNSGTLDELYAQVDDIVQTCSNPTWTGKIWSPDFVLPNEHESYQP